MLNIPTPSFSFSRKIVFIGLISFASCTSSLVAQQHYNAWFRVSGRYLSKNRVSADLELQHRRQQAYNDHNPFHHNLMFSLRPWFYYQAAKDIRIEVLPLSYYRLYPVIEKASDQSGSPLTEYRSALGLSLKRSLNTELGFSSRFMLEYRNFNRGNDLLRLRARTGLDYQLSDRCRLTLQEEILVNMRGTTADHLFDHNRISISLARKYKTNSWIEMGYIYVNRLTPRNTGLLTEHNFFIHAGIPLTKKRRPQ